MSHNDNNNRIVGIICPHCRTRSEHAIPATYDLVAQECDHCGSLFEVPAGAHCLFCAYGDAPCGVMQP
jgi:uncharacterized OB-fold protein